jgi:uncharacterized protein (DUF2252 family)
VSLIESSNSDRLEYLLPVRFGRMSESAFAFFRGTANVQAYDLKNTPSSGIIVQCCGDCHLLNFGGFATPERTLVFDINDFDETFPAPFEWDVKRLAASFVLAGRWLQFDAADCRIAAAAAVASYRQNTNRFSEMKVLDVWYSRITVDSLRAQIEHDEEFEKRVKRAIAKAQLNTSERVFNRYTREVDGKIRIIDEPPLLYHADPSMMDFEDLMPFFEAYRESLLPSQKSLYDRFHLVDFAYKVVGVGSVGTRCFVTLFMAESDDPLFLQVKQARASVLEGLAGPPRWAHNGERVVTGQRLMQSASDIFLGWSTGPHGRDYYFRQLRDMKLAPILVGFTPNLLHEYARACGQTLARAHAKAGAAAEIAGYLGNATTFDEAVADYAVAYADQVETDFAAFQFAIRSGRVTTDTVSAELEQTLR